MASISEDEFRFDKLAIHISQNKAPDVVTIGEDATCLISHVEWDAETNQCCGFVLPVKEKELPVVGPSHLRALKGCSWTIKFQSSYAYGIIIMAQPFLGGCLLFCLMIVGTDNKFTARSVLLQWCCIMMSVKSK